MSTEAEPLKRSLVLDAIDHKETWRIPHMIQFHGNIGKVLAAHYGVNEPGAIVDDNPLVTYQGV